MNQVKLIHDFVDGELDSGQEESLFFALSGSGELRQEMKELLAMKQAARSFTDVYMPSAGSTMAVFSSLGFDTPNFASNSSNPASTASGFTNFYRRNSRSIKTGIASSVLTAILVFFLLRPGDSGVNNSFAGSNGNAEQSQLINNSLNNNNLIHKNYNSIHKNNNSIKKEVPVIASTADISEKFNSISTNSINTNTAESINSGFASELYGQNAEVKSVPIDDANDETANDINSNVNSSDYNIITSNSKINSSNTVTYASRFDIGKAEQFTNPLPGSLEFNSPFYIPRTANVKVSNISGFGIDDLFGFSAELRGSQNWNSEKATLPPSDYAKFNNYSFALFYDLSEVFSVGLDVRQETFFNRFYGKDADGIMKTFETQPNYTSLGLALRYYAMPNANLKPFAQITLGGNSVGLASRAMAGLKYEPYRNIAFVIGLEYSNLAYWFDNNSFNSSKVGLNYGVQYIW